MRGLDGPPKPEQIEAIKREVRNIAVGGMNVGSGGGENIGGVGNLLRFVVRMWAQTDVPAKDR
jgi:hypothetical protein